MALTPLSISLSSVRGVAIAEISGTFYEGLESAEQAIEPIERHAEAHAWRLALGLRGITFLNSRGISTLLNLRGACDRRGGCFVMYELFEAAENALVTLRLVSILKIAGSREDAVRICLERSGPGAPPGPRSADVPGAAPSRPPRLAVMISGAGRTFINLADRIADHSLVASVCVVIASRECAGADEARARGIPVRVVPGRVPRATLARLLAEFGADFLVLAGYLKFVEVPPGFAGRVVNIHPSLLPAHGGEGMYGRRVHEAVLAAGETESGCTVHLVEGAYDTGPVLLQARCPVLPGDTPDTLAARVFDLELRAYPRALRLLFERAAASRATKRAS